MSWFFETLVAPSEINGPITCVRSMGRWSVLAGDNGQTNSYLNTMWREGFRRLPKDVNVKRILMLGYATGGTLGEYKRRFPKATITAVEIDPVMVELSKQFMPAKLRKRVEVIVGDAYKVLPTLQGTYDLVIFDMFLGIKVAPVTREHELIKHALRLLQPYGAIFVNSYTEPDVLDVFRGLCGEVARWKFSRYGYTNNIGLFRPWGAGTLGDPLPKEYQHSTTCEPYLLREFAGRSAWELIHAGDALAIRRTTPFFSFDYYTGDAEPIGRPAGKRRIVTFWQRFARTDKPAGWKSCPLPGNRRFTGFAIIPETGPYHLNWSEHAKRHRARWLKQTTHEIIETDVETYVKAYQTCDKERSLKYLFSMELRRKAKAHPGLMRFRVACDRATGEIIAGFASLWIPEIKQTFHVTAFITRAGKETSAAFGMMDDVFKLSQERGCRTLEFDGFWTEGNPNSWKGFSHFKAQFGPYYIRWPNPLIRFD